MANGTDFDVSEPCLHTKPCDIRKHAAGYSPSACSIASSPSSSSSSSVDSVDAPSSQSSVSPGSVDSSSAGWTNEHEDLFYNASYSRRGSSDSSDEALEATSHSSDGVVLTSYNSAGGLVLSYKSLYHPPTVQPITGVIAPEARKHPRRTQRLTSCESQDGKTTTAGPRPPATLVRQSERKDNFVDSLVDTSTQMIETIWPLSVLSCSREATSGVVQQNLIGLRTFVQEVLRRSKTTYSTLQVALYYLILIRSCIPKHDFTMEQSEDSLSCRAMQCGRRMFLAALILASKYLQDRNYSARAWSKISGLRTCEINQNEMAFLSAVNWKLHISERVFKRWNNIVLKYSPSAQVNTPRSYPPSAHTWKSIVPLLTPELDSFALGSLDLSDDSGYNSPGSNMSPPPVPIREKLPPLSAFKDATPTNPCTISRTPTPSHPYTVPPEIAAMSMGSTRKQTMPSLPRPAPLPTPDMTPQIGAICTPAVSASGFCPGRPAMGYAMAQVNSNCLARSTLDNPHEWAQYVPASHLLSMPPRQSPSAKSASSISSKSSPESVVSDNSSRSSRSSSISSVASSNCALPPPSLAVQATRRCANMQLCGLKKEQQRPANFEYDRGFEKSAAMESNRTPVASRGLLSSSSPTELAPRVHDRRLWEEYSETKRLDRENSIEFLSHFVKQSETSSVSAHEAAAALQDLAQSHPHHHSHPPPPPARPRPQRHDKRPRPNSMDDFTGMDGALQDIKDTSELQAAVRATIAPRCLGDIINKHSRLIEEDGKVVIDRKRADSFLEPKNGNKKPSLNIDDVDSEFLYQTKGKPTISRDSLPRKKARAGSDKRGRGIALTINRSIKEKMLDGRLGPGMWDGILD